METTNTTQIATLGGRQVHLSTDGKTAICGATSVYRMVATTRPVTCKKCQKGDH